MPLGWATALARRAGWILAHGVRVRRGYVRTTLARCLPEKSEAEHRAIYAEMWEHQALNAMELLRFLGGQEAEMAARIDLQGEAIFHEALARGKGVLVLYAHIGNYVLPGVCLSKTLGFPVSAVYKPLKSGVMDDLWRDVRRRGGMAGIPARNAYRACLRALRHNELVGFMLDQNRPANQGVFVDFFGRPASTTPGLALLSAQTGAPVVPVFTHRTMTGRHEVQVRPLIEPPPDRQPQTILEHTAHYTRLIEEEIRRHPAQWLWLHKRWKSQPPISPGMPADGKVGAAKGEA